MKPWRPIPDSRTEVLALATEWPGATVRVGKDATEALYRSEARRHRFIHIAAHGILDPTQPLYSGLALTPSDGHDGLLHAYEVFAVPLQAELVTLTACETSVGPVRAGEGVLALSRAFLAAGARSVIVTQWAVPDAASQLMPEFYTLLRAGHSKADALRAAKRAMMLKTLRTAGGSSYSLAHPLFWAPYVLVGLP